MSRTAGSKNGQHGAGIDEKKFRSLCGMMCTEVEICDFFGCSHDTLNRWCHDQYGLTFGAAWSRFSSFGKISLRRYQFNLAETNPTMAIWLGKQYLGQTDGEKEDTQPIDKIEVVFTGETVERKKRLDRLQAEAMKELGMTDGNQDRDA